MKKFLFLFFFIYLNITDTNSQATPVFISGTEGHKSFRIPAIIKLKNGDLEDRRYYANTPGHAIQLQTKPYRGHILPDPICKGSLLKISEKKGQAVLAFCNAASIKERNNLTLRISYDERKSWPVNIPVYVGKDNKSGLCSLL